MVAWSLNREMERRIQNAPTRAQFVHDNLLVGHSGYGAADSEGFWAVEQILDRVYGIE
jgi:hypothetical protein